jgi:hypothetical protein
MAIPGEVDAPAWRVPRTSRSFPPRLTGLVEEMLRWRRGTSRLCRRGVRWRETGGNRDPAGAPGGPSSSRVSAAQGMCGRDRIRTCVGNAGDFTVRSAGSSRVPRHPRLVPDYRRDVHEQLSTASAVTRRPRPFRLVPRGPASSGGKSEGNPLGPGQGWDRPHIHRVGGTPRE